MMMFDTILNNGNVFITHVIFYVIFLYGVNIWLSIVFVKFYCKMYETVL